MKYVLDTSILLVYLRNHKNRQVLENKYALFSLPNIPIISVVTIGEIRSLAIRNEWGIKRLRLLSNFLDELVIADIK